MSKGNDSDIPDEIDFSEGVRGVHHIPADARVLMPASRDEGESEGGEETK